MEGGMKYTLASDKFFITRYESIELALWRVAWTSLEKEAKLCLVKLDSTFEVCDAEKVALTEGRPLALVEGLKNLCVDQRATVEV